MEKLLKTPTHTHSGKIMRRFKKASAIFLAFALTLTGITFPSNIYRVSAEEGDNEVVEIISLDTLTAPKKAYLYNFVDASAGYQVVFTDGNDYTGVVNADISYAVYINNSYVTSVSASKDFIDASLIDDLNLTEGNQYSFAVMINANWSDGTNTQSSLSEATTFRYSKGTNKYDTGIASVYVTTSRDSTTSNIDLYTDTSKTKVNAAITVLDTDGSSLVADNFGTINVRGNSTALADKKPYNIKFDSKQNLFSMGKAKKWSLLANIFDKTLMRNKIGMDFQRYLEETRDAGQVYTSECLPVDLYVDGIYLGNYLLIESVETGTTRVDLDESYIDENDNVADTATATSVTIGGVTYNTYDALLEVANDIKETSSRYDEESYYFRTSYDDEYFAINSPARSNTSYDYVVTSSNKPAWVSNTQSFINAFEKVINTNYSSAQTQYDLIEQFIDVDSFVDFYITSEYFMTKDINFSSTRFYIKNGKLYGGPLWDLDLSSGNIVDHTSYTDFYAQRFAWFSELMNNSIFKSKVIERYKELQPVIKALYADGGTVDSTYNTILLSANKNYSVAYNTHDYTGWHLSTNYGAYNSTTTYSTYIAYVNEYKTWLANRNTWLRNQWSITDDVVETSTEASETSTQAETTEKAEVTTSVSDDWQMPALSEYTTANGGWNNLPYWSVYFASGWANNPKGSYRSGAGYDDFGLYVQTAPGGDWALQMKTQSTTVTAGETYIVDLTVYSSQSTGNVVRLKDDPSGTETFYALSVGSNKLTLSFTAKSTAQIFLDLGNIPADTQLEVTSFKLYNAKEETSTPAETITETQSTTEATTADPIEVIGVNISNPRDNVIGVVWGQNNEQIALGQTYNIYIDNEKVADQLSCAYYEFDSISTGTHTVKVTATVNSKETEGYSGQVTVTGPVETESEKATEAQTTEKVTEEVTTEKVTEEITTEKVTEEAGNKNEIVISDSVSIDGYQISDIAQGFRTVYSAESTINSMTVEEVGLVYALAGTEASAIYVGSSENNVYSYAATDAGIIEGQSFGQSTSATYYAMTMKFASGSVNEFTTDMSLRAYAKLSDGSYVYTPVYSYSIYKVADYLYQNKMCNRLDAHTYLYEKILSAVNPDYAAIDFTWSNYIVKTGNI